MLIFLIVFLAALLMLIGLVLLVFPGPRWLSAYLLLCPLFSALLSIVLSTGVALLLLSLRFAVGNWVPDWILGSMAVVGYLGGLFAGGVAGLPVGMWLARKINRRWLGDQVRELR